MTSLIGQAASHYSALSNLPFGGIPSFAEIQKAEPESGTRFSGASKGELLLLDSVLTRRQPGNSKSQAIHRAGSHARS